MVVVFGLALAVGVYLTVEAGWPVVAIGLAAIASAVAYTGGPFPLGYHGLGDLFVMMFFGFAAVCGTAFVQAEYVPAAAWPAGFAAGCLATAILVVNNVRDIEQDRESGKRTLPVRFGRSWGVTEFAGLIALAYLVPSLLVLTGRAGASLLFVLLSLPLALSLVRSLRHDRGPVLNHTLAGTARLFLVWSVLYSAGLVLGSPA